GGHLEITPVAEAEGSLRRYSEQDIAKFLEEDKLDQATANRVRRLLKAGRL
ncbi:MAG: hypothetical protein HY261_05355, partial [Chloroflexi bacterium]|nr:hypothetical protein [Chloroflexota bacterium]